MYVTNQGYTGTIDYRDIQVAEDGVDAFFNGTQRIDMQYGIGDEQNDLMIGGTGNDVLFGDGGDDVLHGEQGHDVLEGGAGNDYLLGGEGYDTYHIYSGDGADTIIDSDGRGMIFYNDMPVIPGVDTDHDGIYEVADSDISMTYNQGKNRDRSNIRNLNLC